MKWHCLFLILLLKASFFQAVAQSIDQRSVLFQGVRGVSYFEESYRPSLEEKLKSQILALRRFELIQRDSLFWKSIRQELEIHDLLNEQTAIKLGNLVGAKYYIEGKLIRIFTENVKDTNGQSGFVANAEASLTMTNLESGKIITVLNCSEKGSGNFANSAVEDALGRVAQNLAGQLKLKFPITASIVSLSPGSITINKGYLDGLALQQSIRTENDKAHFKITQLTNHEATARIMSGSTSFLRTGQQLIESTESALNSAKVTQLNKRTLILDAGDEIGLRKGDLLVSSIQNSASKTEQGTAVITKVSKEQSEAKIIHGSSFISMGSVLTETKDRSKRRAPFISIGYKSAISPSIKPSQAQGPVDVINPLGTFSINTDYLQNFSTIQNVNVLSVGLGSQNFVKNISSVLRADIYQIGQGRLNNWTASLDLTYNHLLIEDRLYFLTGGSIGYGRLKQTIPQGVVEKISGGNSSDLKASSISLSANTGLQLSLRSIDLIATVSYHYLDYSKWKYRLKENNSEKEYEMPSSVIPYPKVNLSGLYFELMIRYKF